MMEEMVVVTTAATRRAKLQSNRHRQQTQTQLFTGQLPFLSPNQQRQRTGLKNYHSTVLAHLKLNWGLSTLCLTIKGSGYLGGRVSKPPVSPLTPVTHHPTNKRCLEGLYLNK